MGRREERNKQNKRRNPETWAEMANILGLGEEEKPVLELLRVVREVNSHKRERDHRRRDLKVGVACFK